jgi:hypothetical protein
MNKRVKEILIYSAICSSLIGCGGGGGSNSTSFDNKTTNHSSENNVQESNNNLIDLSNSDFSITKLNPTLEQRLKLGADYSTCNVQFYVERGDVKNDELELPLYKDSEKIWSFRKSDVNSIQNLYWKDSDYFVDLFCEKENSKHFGFDLFKEKIFFYKNGN